MRELEHGAPLAHAAEVAHPRLEHVAVRDDDLLAREAAKARALDAHVLDRALEAVDGEEVAEPEGLIERDRERGEEIREHRLHRERERDAADPETREERGDLHAESGES